MISLFQTKWSPPLWAASWLGFVSLVTRVAVACAVIVLLWPTPGMGFRDRLVTAGAVTRIIMLGPFASLSERTLKTDWSFIIVMGSAVALFLLLASLLRGANSRALVIAASVVWFFNGFAVLALGIT